MSPEVNDDVWAEVAFDTLAVRAGTARTNEGEHSEALFLTSSFVFDSAAHAAARFGGTEAGNIYSRFTNPTVRTFEQRLAALEGGERAVATSSGMAAILATALAFLSAGDHVVCSRAVFGTTNVLFEKYLKKFGVTTTFVSLTDLEEWRTAIQPSTKLFFLETPSNPMCEVADIAALANLAHQHGIRVESIPGPCAAMAALAGSGLPSDRFQFNGFLPAKQQARKTALEKLSTETATLIFY